MFRPQLVGNPHDSRACVKGHFIYQKKGRDDVWEDCDSPSLQSLKRGEHVELELRSGELLPLLEQLGELTRLHWKEGQPRSRMARVRLRVQLAKLLELTEAELGAFLDENTDKAISTMRRVLAWLARNPRAAQQLAEDSEDLPELSALVGVANLRAVLKMWAENRDNADEEFWQKVLSEHSYVLSQLFAYPLVVIAKRLSSAASGSGTATSSISSGACRLPGRPC